MFTKISICLFLLRIVDSRKVRIAMHILIGFIITFTAVFVFLFIGICRPLKAYWDVGVDGTCFSNHQITGIVIAQGGEKHNLSGTYDSALTQLVFSVVTDIICAAFPVFFLRNLQVKTRTKVALCSLMGLGVM